MKIIKTYILIFMLVVTSVLIYMYISNKRCPPDGFTLVSTNWLDSLQAIADSQPEVITITKDSIVYVKGPVEFVEIKVPVEVDKETNYYEDTIKTKHFDLYLFDTLRQNKIMSRAFTYDLHVPEIITNTITQIQKVPFPYEVDRRGRLYGSINAGSIISADISYRIDDYMIGLGYGYDHKGNKMIYAKYTFKIF